MRERDLLKSKVAFLDGRAEEWKEGLELAGRARSEKDRGRRAELYTQAADHFRTCATRGNSALASSPRLKVPLVIGDAVTTAGAVVQRCAAELDAAVRALKKRPTKKSVSSSREMAKKR